MKILRNIKKLLKKSAKVKAIFFTGSLTLCALMGTAVSTMAWFSHLNAPITGGVKSGSIGLEIDGVTGTKNVLTTDPAGFLVDGGEKTEDLTGATSTTNVAQDTSNTDFDVPASGTGYYLIRGQVSNDSTVYTYGNTDVKKFKAYTGSTRVYAENVTLSGSATFQIKHYYFKYNGEYYGGIQYTGETKGCSDTITIPSNNDIYGGVATVSGDTITASASNTYKVWFDYANNTLGFEETDGVNSIVESIEEPEQKPALMQGAEEQSIGRVSGRTLGQGPKRSATGTPAGTRIYIEDQTGKKWTGNGVDPVVHMWNVAVDSTSKYASASDIEADAFGASLSNDGSGILDVKMSWTSGSHRQYELTIPWYITSFKACFYATENGNDRYIKYNGSSDSYELSATRGKEYKLYLCTMEGYGPWWDGTTFRTGISKEENSSYTYTETTYTITLAKTPSAGGTVEGGGTYLKNKKITISATANTGYSFTSWSDSGAASHTVNVTADITYTATFSPNIYTITYKDQGNVAFSGTHASGYPTQHTYATATALKTASKTGYSFGGWFTNPDCTGTAVTSLGATAYTAGITLYAKWTANQYDINYLDGGGSAFSGTHETGYPAKHTYGTTTTLKDATKDGYDFDGWFANPGCTGAEVTSLGATAYTAGITLYAKWTAKTSTLSFDLNTTDSGSDITTGSTTASPTYATYDSALPTLSGIPTRTYNGPWVFLGYFDAAEGGTRYYNSDLSANVDAWDKNTTSGTTLYAHWSQDKFTLAYNGNGSTSGSHSSVINNVVGASTSIVANPFTKTGHHFVGWIAYNKYGTGSQTVVKTLFNDSGVATSVTFDIDKIANGDTVTLVAQWEADTYTITYKDQGNADFSGSHSSTPPTSHTYGVNTALNFATKTGYTFEGWFGNSSCTGVSIESLGATDYTDAIVLYAKWTPITYTLTYKDQGNVDFSGSHADGHPTSHTYGTATTLKTASKTGYTFNGWYTNSTCTEGPVTSLGATAYTANITLYAKWTPITYTITYLDQGGVAFSGTHATGYPTSHTYATATTLKAASKEGYTFDGWYTNSACTEGPVSSLGATAYTANITLYAKWTAITYYVHFEGNDATSGSMSNQQFTYDQASTALSTNAFAKDGYEFDGWSLVAGAARQYTDGQLVQNLLTTAGTYTIYARWTKTVTLDKQNGTGGTDTISVVWRASVPSSVTAPTRTGYTFGGYYTGTNGTSTKVYNGGTGTVSYITTDSANIWTYSGLYAYWTANNYIVTFDKQSGSGGLNSVSATYDSAMPAMTRPTRSGYTFQGYFTEAGGSGTKYYNADGTSAQNWDIAGERTLYAHWTVNKYTITLNLESGTSGSTSVTATYDSPLPDVETLPTRSGYIFLGYYTSTNGAGTVYYDYRGKSTIGNYTTAGGMPLYAYWASASEQSTHFLAGETYQLSVANSSQWRDSSPVFAVYLQNETTGRSVWYALTETDTNFYSITIPQGKWEKLTFTRFPGGTTSFSESGLWNKTTAAQKGNSSFDVGDNTCVVQNKNGDDNTYYEPYDLEWIQYNFFVGGSTVYFKNTDWTNQTLKLYVFNNTKNTNQDQVPVKNIGGGYFSTTIPEGQWQGIIFYYGANIGSTTAQTADITSLGDASEGEVMYDNSTNTWKRLDGTVSGGTNIYFKPTTSFGTWNNNRYAVYAYGYINDSTPVTGAWISLAAATGTGGYYYGQLPAGNIFRVIICAMDSSNNTNDWDNKKAQTADLIFNANTPLFTLTDNAGNVSTAAGPYVVPSNGKLVLDFTAAVNGNDPRRAFTNDSPVVVAMLSDGGTSVTYVKMSEIFDQSGNPQMYLALMGDYEANWWFTVEFLRIDPNHYNESSPDSSEIWNTVSPSSRLSGSGNNCFQLNNSGNFSSGSWTQRSIKENGWYLVGSTVSEDPNHPLNKAGGNNWDIDGAYELLSHNIGKEESPVYLATYDDDNDIKLENTWFLPGDQFKIVHVTNYVPDWFGYRASGISATTSISALFSTNDDNNVLFASGTITEYAVDVFYRKGTGVYVNVDGFSVPLSGNVKYYSTLDSLNASAATSGTISVDVTLSGTSIGSIAVSDGSTLNTINDYTFDNKYTLANDTATYSGITNAIGQTVGSASPTIYAVYKAATVTVTFYAKSGNEWFVAKVQTVDKGSTLSQYTIFTYNSEYTILNGSDSEGYLYAFKPYSEDRSFYLSNTLTGSTFSTSTAVTSNQELYIKADGKDLVTFYIDVSAIWGGRSPIHITSADGATEYFTSYYESPRKYNVAPGLYRITMPTEWNFRISNGLDQGYHANFDGLNNWSALVTTPNASNESGVYRLCYLGTSTNACHPVNWYNEYFITGTAEIWINGVKAADMSLAEHTAGKNYFIYEKGLEVHEGYSIEIKVDDAAIGISSFNASNYGESLASVWYLDTSTQAVTAVLDEHLLETWDKVYAYAWKSSDDSVRNHDWPGEEMSVSVDDPTHFFITLDSGAYDRIIFSNGNSGTSNQTGSQTFTRGSSYLISPGDNNTINCTIESGGLYATDDCRLNFYIYYDSTSSAFKWTATSVPFLGNGYYIMPTEIPDKGNANADGFRDAIKMLTLSSSEASYGRFYAEAGQSYYIRSYLSAVDTIYTDFDITAVIDKVEINTDNRSKTSVFTFKNDPSATGYYSIIVYNDKITITQSAENSFFRLNSLDVCSAATIRQQNTTFIMEIKFTVTNEHPIAITVDVTNGLAPHVGCALWVNASRINGAYTYLRSDERTVNATTFYGSLSTSGMLTNLNSATATLTSAGTYYAYIMIDYLDKTMASAGDLSGHLSFTLVASQAQEVA